MPGPSQDYVLIKAQKATLFSAARHGKRRLDQNQKELHRVRKGGDDG